MRRAKLRRVVADPVGSGLIKMSFAIRSRPALALMALSDAALWRQPVPLVRVAAISGEDATRAMP
jgi:hypothetical protein